MAEISAERGLFGGNCTYDRVIKELSGYSDHQLHVFSSESAVGGSAEVCGVSRRSC